MKCRDLDFDQVKFLCLRCPIKLPVKTGKTRLEEGEFFCYPAKREEVKRFTKVAKADALAHQLRGEKDYLGRVMIGRKTFIHFPKASALIRVDFASWCDDHADNFLKKDGSERLPTKSLHSEKLAPVPTGRTYLDVKDRVKRFHKLTGLLHETAWNKEFDMRKTLDEYAKECKEGLALLNEYNAIPHIQANILLALIAYRFERDYARAADAFLDVAANAIQAAEWIMENHSKPKTEEAK